MLANGHKELQTSSELNWSRLAQVCVPNPHPSVPDILADLWTKLSFDRLLPRLNEHYSASSQAHNLVSYLQERQDPIDVDDAGPSVPSTPRGQIQATAVHFGVVGKKGIINKFLVIKTQNNKLK